MDTVYITYYSRIYTAWSPHMADSEDEHQRAMQRPWHHRMGRMKHWATSAQLWPVGLHMARRSDDVAITPLALPLQLDVQEPARVDKYHGNRARMIDRSDHLAQKWEQVEPLGREAAHGVIHVSRPQEAKVAGAQSAEPTAEAKRQRWKE